MNLPFRDVMPALTGALAPFVSADREITVLRDVAGKVRVLIQGLHAVPSAALAAQVEAAVRPAIGEWLDLHQPVWIAPKKVQGPTATPNSIDLILNELTRSRVHIQPGLSLVERHVSKDAWTANAPYDPPWSRDDVIAGGMPPIVTFFSHKGGVGRTTTAVATALLAAQAGKRVALLDLDLEAPGLGALMGEDLVPAEGVLDLLIAPSLEPGPLEQARYILNDPGLIGEHGGSLAVLTAGTVDDGYLEMLARLDLDTGANREEIKTRLSGLLRLIRDEWSPDLILVDARAGFHDLGGLMLASLSHAAVMVLTANPQSLHGLRRVGRLLSSPYRATGEHAVPLVVVHGMAPEVGSGEAGQLERDRVRQSTYDILVDGYYPQDRSPPDPSAIGQPHDLLALPWQGPLRGRGGQLDPEIAALLRGEPYQRLYQRVLGLYPR